MGNSDTDTTNQAEGLQNGAAVRPIVLNLDNNQLRMQEPHTPMDEAFNQVAEQLKHIGDQIDTDFADRLLNIQPCNVTNEQTIWVVCKNGLQSCLSAAKFGLMVAEKLTSL